MCAKHKIQSVFCVFHCPFQIISAQNLVCLKRLHIYIAWKLKQVNGSVTARKKLYDDTSISFNNKVSKLVVQDYDDTTVR